MNKTLLIIIAAAVVLGLVVGGYFYWQSISKTPEEKAAEALQKSIEAVTGAVLPEITTETNPLEKSPDINPVSKTNPFKGLYKNPFE